MFGGEKDPDNGDKVDVIVEVYQPSPLLACTVLYFTVLYFIVLYCTLCQVCGHSSVVKRGVARLRPGGVAVLVGCSRYYLTYLHISTHICPLSAGWLRDPGHSPGPDGRHAGARLRHADRCPQLRAPRPRDGGAGGA